MTRRPKPGRIACVVPFCKRTAPRDPNDDANAEIICGGHKRLVDSGLRRLHRRVCRKVEGLEVCRANLGLAKTLFGIERRVWAKMKEQAIERAAGIA
ncbi:hypothetical protein [Dongia deserti]|uniref:hypothetical protein n=1 Tax=Dongia deserti TaxID=2268030 RepID=UPI000E646128|nr:hypothetical protein [Dongia deserti]